MSLTLSFFSHANLFFSLNALSQNEKNRLVSYITQSQTHISGNLPFRDITMRGRLIAQTMASAKCWFSPDSLLPNTRKVQQAIHFCTLNRAKNALFFLEINKVQIKGCLLRLLPGFSHMKWQFTTQVQREWGMWSASILGVIVVIKPMINITAVQVNGSLAIKPAVAADIVLRFTLPWL